MAVSLTKIAQDIALMGSGPRTGIGELALPELQKGSSIMPGKVNPVIPEVVLQVAAQVIGNDTAITIGGMQGQFELNVRIPLIGAQPAPLDHDPHERRDAVRREVRRRRSRRTWTCNERHAESTPAIATALNPHIGYDKATEIVKESVASKRHDPRGRDREGRRRVDARRGARPARDGAAARPADRLGQS